MKIGELDMKCGDCILIDHCGEPWSDVAICMEQRLKDIDEENFYKYLENALGKTKQDIIDNAYCTYLCRGDNNK